MNDAGLYLHIPFCPGKCLYCSFNSRPLENRNQLDAYVAALFREIELMADHPWRREKKFTTLFLGGGTPTVLDGPTLAKLIKRCRIRFELNPDAEISIEANPGTLDEEKLDLIRAAGANRLSIGAQSFSDRLLAAIGRRHNARQAVEAVRLARRAGFADLSLDLISGLPGQTAEDWRQSLDTACGLEPTHLSLYELMIEEGSAFHGMEERGELLLPDEDTMAAIDGLTESRLALAGFERYEISNWGRDGYRCRHNVGYWRNGSYLGLGAGAVSCFDGLRLKNIDDPRRYAELITAGKPPYAEGEMLPREASLRETVIMGLRMVEGVELACLADRYGITAAEVYGPLLDRLAADGLIVIKAGRLRLSARAMPVANQVLCQLV